MRTGKLKQVADKCWYLQLDSRQYMIQRNFYTARWQVHLRHKSGGYEQIKGVEFDSLETALQLLYAGRH